MANRNLRNVHLRIKEDLIKEYTLNKIVLDLGFGRGGDIWNYKKANVKYVWGVEPNEKNYNEANDRFKNKIERQMFHIIPTVAQDTKYIKKVLERPVDVVVSFFSLTFFYKSEQDLDAFINTVSSNLKKGGIFMGTTMDGDRTEDLLKGKKDFTSESFQMIKKFNDNTPKTLGKEIVINISGKDAIVKQQTEYLVYFDIFIEKLNKVGIKLLKTEYFKSPSGDVLTTLNRLFVFKKV